MNCLDKFHNWLLSARRHYRHRVLYIIADPADNSITLSKHLFRHMRVMQQSQAKVFVFSYKEKTGEKSYGFVLNPPGLTDTQLADIQFNSKHKTVGFESLCPSVNRIFYDYRLPDRKVKLSVEPHTIGAPSTKFIYYKILRPCHQSR